MKRVVWAVVTLVMIAVAAATISLRLIDTPAVRAQIQARLAAALGGRIEWESLELRVFPAPHGELQRVRIEIPGALSARADDVDVYLRLWPLLLGRAEIASIAVLRPQVRLDAAGGGQSGGALDPVAAYRGAIAPLAGALRKFAPDTVLTIRGATLDIASSPVGLRDLNVSARSAGESLELDIDTASNLWQRLRLEVRVAYADLSARGTLKVDELTLRKDLPAATLSAQLRTDAKTAIECDVEAGFGSLLPAAKARLLLPAGGKPAELDARLSRIDLAQALALARRNLSGLEVMEGADGRLTANVRLSLGEQWRAQVDIVESDASVKLAPLPAPVSLASGSVRVAPDAVRLEALAVAMLDARVLVSGTVATKGPRIELALAEGMLGDKIVQWALARAEVPARFEPRTPLRFAAKRIVWTPGAPLEADAAIDFEGGPGVAVALAWQPERLDLRRLAIKDARSDAVLGATVGGNLLHASFSGTLYGNSIASMLRQPQGDSGVARGKLRLSVDREQPQRSVAEGQLRVEALDLTWLAGAKALLKSIDFSADRSILRIARAELEWQEQPVSVRGEIRSTGQGPVIDARLESPGVVVERLLPAEKSGATAGEPKQSKLWPLPVTGRVEVRAGFVQYQHYKVAPLEGSLVLERERAHLEVKEARMCGVSFPLSAEAMPDRLAVAAQITMKDEPMEQAMRCLTGNAVEITGNADLHADLRSRGKAEDLIRNLTGTAHAELRKGRIRKFALIGNILSLRGIPSLHGMKEEGFAYRSLSARGRFEAGEFLLEEGFFDSDAARLAASGRIDLVGANSRLNVLVGLLTTVDRVAGAVPLLGDVFGGSLTALPVAVSGDIRNPRVVPLGARAVSDRLLGIFERTLKLPGKLVVPAAGEAPR